MDISVITDLWPVELYACELIGVYLSSELTTSPNLKCHTKYTKSEHTIYLWRKRLLLWLLTHCWYLSLYSSNVE